jgi:hypothetical protein
MLLRSCIIKCIKIRLGVQCSQSIQQLENDIFRVNLINMFLDYVDKTRNEEIRKELEILGNAPSP